MKISHIIRNQAHLPAKPVNRFLSLLDAVKILISRLFVISPHGSHLQLILIYPIDMRGYDFHTAANQSGFAFSPLIRRMTTNLIPELADLLECFLDTVPYLLHLFIVVIWICHYDSLSIQLCVRLVQFNV